MSSYTYAQAKAAMKALNLFVSEGTLWTVDDQKSFETFITIAGMKINRTGISALDPLGFRAAYQGFAFDGAPDWVVNAICGSSSSASPGQ